LCWCVLTSSQRASLGCHFKLSNVTNYIWMIPSPICLQCFPRHSSYKCTPLPEVLSVLQLVQSDRIVFLLALSDQMSSVKFSEWDICNLAAYVQHVSSLHLSQVQLNLVNCLTKMYALFVVGYTQPHEPVFLLRQPALNNFFVWERCWTPFNKQHRKKPGFEVALLLRPLIKFWLIAWS